MGRTIDNYMLKDIHKKQCPECDGVGCVEVSREECLDIIRHRYVIDCINKPADVMRAKAVLRHWEETKDVAGYGQVECGDCNGTGVVGYE